jgi:hypothetical protein
MGGDLVTVSAPLDVKFKIDTRPMVAGLQKALRQVREFGDLVRYLGEREDAARRLVLGRALQAADPRWDVQVVTTNEGRCRVVVRKLGGWA